MAGRARICSYGKARRTGGDYFPDTRVQRLNELKEFLATRNNPGNRRRIAEIDEELKRIEKRLAEIA
jgi:hypothetical protein